MATRKPPTIELISKKTRRELQEYFVGSTLREIEHAFDDAGIDCDTEYVSQDSGQRRCLGTEKGSELFTTAAVTCFGRGIQNKHDFRAGTPHRLRGLVPV